MARVLSGIQPTGDLHLGNYVGAIRRWAVEQQPEHFYCVVDLHALTVDYDPAELRSATRELATWLMATGLDPTTVTLFVQSQVREHSELAWILQCVATYGELHRMVQFKEKGQGRQSVPAALLTYPVLQAADILLYHADEVPIGADQRQHLELARTVAARFNQRFGEVMTEPTPTFPEVGARVMDLQHPDHKMSKSLPAAGGLFLGEDENATAKKVQRAVTDSGTEIRRGDDKPGVTNLLELLSAVTGSDIADLEQRYAGAGYGAVKRDVAEAVNAFLRPVRERHAELAADPGAVEAALRDGAERAREVAAATMERVRDAVGLLS